jgi:hypothetical protein
MFRVKIGKGNCYKSVSVACDQYCFYSSGGQIRSFELHRSIILYVFRHNQLFMDTVDNYSLSVLLYSFYTDLESTDMV